MKVTNAILKDLVHCSYKVFNGLKRNSVPDDPEISTLFKRLKESHFKQVMEAKTVASISFNVTLENERFCLTFDGIEQKSKSNQIAIMTVPFERITKADKVFLALKSHFAEKEFSLKISHCKIIYGGELNTTYFKISSFKRHISKLTNRLEELGKKSFAPTFYKNDHCPFCRFHHECIEALRGRDDLSLLAGLKPNEIASKNNRGIFTVRQLSFMFKVKKNPYRRRSYRPELKALAIRENKTYILEGCNIPKSTVQVFLDIEGLPEQNFHYLIGLIIRTNDQLRTFSLWADRPQDQKKLFEDMLSILSRYDDITIYHYGSYENKVLATFLKLYPEYNNFFERTIANKTFNVLSILAEYVYPPTYSNGLKEVARFVQFQWTDDSANGLQSMVWRYNWEFARDEKLKQKLLHYNIDDCRALMKVFDWVCACIESDRNNDILSPPKPVNFYKWGITNYAITEFKSINEKAYFNYQRNHIALRKSKNGLRKKLPKAAAPRFNKPTRRLSLFPLTCPNCKCKDVVFKRSQKVQIDLLFMKAGVKSSVTVYEGGPFKCSRCRSTFKGTDMKCFPKYGRNLMIWAVNQKIQYNLSSQSVINFLKDTVNISVSPTQMTRFKQVMALAYKKTYEEIRERMVNSTLIHADETIARIKGIDGYVWVLANHECVYYEFRKTRETAFLKTLLASFRGTLVSDFYLGYDSIACDQQKCLIHLIRDMNADFLRNQFDQDFKFLVTEFGKLLKKIISTIDMFGLKKFHLHKHFEDVSKFYRTVVDKTTESEINQNYQRRLRKYREKLFHFLTADNVPWNNNNAEHSIKPFAKWREAKKCQPHCGKY